MQLRSLLFKIPVPYVRTQASLAWCADVFLLLYLCFLLCLPPIFLDTCLLMIVNYIKQGSAFAWSTAISLVSSEAGTKSCLVWCMNKYTLHFFLPADERLPDFPAAKLLSSFWLTLFQTCVCVYVKGNMGRNGEPGARYDKQKWYLILCCWWLFRFNSEKGRDHIFILTVTLGLRTVSG